MNVVRVVLGIMMLGSSLWLLSLLTVHIGSLPVITLGVLLILTLLLVTAALPLANGTARRGISCSSGRSSRVCIRLRRRGSRRDRIHWQPLGEQAIARALAENNRCSST